MLRREGGVAELCLDIDCTESLMNTVIVLSLPISERGEAQVAERAHGILVSPLLRCLEHVQTQIEIRLEHKWICLLRMHHPRKMVLLFFA